jgi:hypothetical protein
MGEYAEERLSHLHPEVFGDRRRRPPVQQPPKTKIVKIIKTDEGFTLETKE